MTQKVVGDFQISGTIPATVGGTGLTTYALGDVLYSSATDTLAKLPGNITSTKKFLTQTGTGTVSAAPAWGTIAVGDVGGGAAITKIDDTNVTLTLGGSPSTALLAASSFTLGWTGILAASRGGTANGFTAFTGPASTTKTFTLPNASDTIGCLGQAQTWTGAQTFGTDVTVSPSSGAGNLILKSGGTSVTLLQGGADNASYLYNQGSAGHLRLGIFPTTIIDLSSGGAAVTGDLSATGEVSWTGTAWSTYTPTITAQTGTPTTVSASGRYKQLGKTIHVQIDITVTSIGTAAGNIIATLPVNAKASTNWVGSAVEYNVNGLGGTTAIVSGLSSSQCYIKQANAATYWVNSYKIVANITYEVA